MDVFTEFPATTFIWCHAGISRRIRVSNLTDHLDRVLAIHRDHVLIDISWVVYPEYVQKHLPRWVALIKKYPENFVLGSDAVGRFGDYPAQIRGFDALFDALGEPEIIGKVARSNFVRSMPSRGVTLEPAYQYPEKNYTNRSLPRR